MLEYINTLAVLCVSLIRRNDHISNIADECLSLPSRDDMLYIQTGTQSDYTERRQTLDDFTA